MSFDAIERSNASGRPVALYEFIFGSKTWRYCGYEENLTVNSVEYTALAISDGGFKMNGDPDDNTLTITCDASIDIADMLNGSPPSETIWVQVRHYHHGDDEAPIMWIGYVGSRKQTNKVTVELVCKMLTAGFDRDGARLTYGRQCPHALYDLACTVDKTAYAVTIEVEKIVGNVIYSDALGDFDSGYFSNGFFSWSRYEGALDRRGVENHAGKKLAILGTASGLSVGTLITLYPGCSRTRSSCINKFNNLSNYGGFPHLPGDSPFQGDPIY